MIFVESISVHPKKVTIKTGEWYYNIREEVFPGHATCPCVTWSSRDPDIAIIHPVSGYIYGGRPGTTVICATATDGSGRRGCCRITVASSEEVTGIMLYPKEQILRVGMSTKLIAATLPVNAVNRLIYWKSSNPKIATVGYYTGSIEAVSEGTAVITATAGGGIQASCQIHVYAKKAIIIVPDIMGTKLKMSSANNAISAQAQIWPPLEQEPFKSAEEYADALGKLDFLACKDDGSSVYDIAADSADTYGAFEIYKNLYLMLNNQYGEERDIVFFGYDWRKPNSVSGALLKNKVNQYDDVILIAHGMGGLVTSHMLKSEKARDRVNQVITLGTSYLGSVDTVLFMLRGQHEMVEEILKTVPDILKQSVKIILQSLLQKLAVNMPAVYELLPTRRFFLQGNYFYLIDENKKMETYAQIKAFLLNCLCLNEKLKTALFDAAEVNHESLWNGNVPVTASVNIYYIAGENCKTVSEYILKSDGEMILSENNNGEDKASSCSATLYPEKTFFAEIGHMFLADPTGNAVLLERIKNFNIGAIDLSESTDDKT